MIQSIQGESFLRCSLCNLATLAAILTLAALWPIAAFADGGAVLAMTSVRHRGGSLEGGAIGSPDQPIYLSVDGKILRLAGTAEPAVIAKARGALTLSPTGAHLAIAWDRLEILDTEANTVAAVEGTGHGKIVHVRWLRGGERLFLVEHGGSETHVLQFMKVDVAGGEPEEICERPAAADNMDFVTVSPDGQRMLVKKNGELELGPLCKAGRKLSQWKGTPLTGGFSPNGNCIAVGLDSGADGPQVLIGSPEGAPKRMSPPGRDAQDPYWLTDDALLFTDGRLGDLWQRFLALYSLGTGKAERVPVPAGCVARVVAAGGGRALIDVDCGKGLQSVGVLSLAK